MRSERRRPGQNVPRTHSCATVPDDVAAAHPECTRQPMRRRTRAYEPRRGGDGAHRLRRRPPAESEEGPGHRPSVVREGCDDAAGRDGYDAAIGEVKEGRDRRRVTTDWGTGLKGFEELFTFHSGWAVVGELGERLKVDGDSWRFRFNNLSEL